MPAAVTLRPRGRRPRVGVTLAVLLAVVVGCGADTGATPIEATSPAVPGLGASAALAEFAGANGYDDLERRTVRLIDGDGRTRLTVAVVVADTPPARTRGLQGVDHVPDGIGMLFAFPDRPASEPRPGFWMLGTAVALDIAFVTDGTVVGVATMQPCVVRPCPVTHPGVPYELALEVVAGTFGAAGVEPGDRLEQVAAGYG